MKPPTRRRRKRILLMTCLLPLLWFVLHVGFSSCDGLNDHFQPTTLGVVFGNKVLRTGQPSARLRRRLSRAVALFRKGTIKHLLVSGGTGKEGFDEAAVMKRFLLRHKIPSHAITCDPHGNNTFLTALHTAQYMHKHRLQRVILISHYHHISRAKLAMRRFGIPDPYHAHATLAFEWRDLYSIFREFIAFYAYLFKRYPQIQGHHGTQIPKR